LIKTLIDDGSVEVREQAYEFLGHLKVFYGEESSKQIL
jgi:hypothetical protein